MRSDISISNRGRKGGGGRLDMWKFRFKANQNQRGQGGPCRNSQQGTIAGSRNCGVKALDRFEKAQQSTRAERHVIRRAKEGINRAEPIQTLYTGRGQNVPSKTSLT
jgi:hypothetical protein